MRKINWRSVRETAEGILCGVAIAGGSMTTGALIWYLLTCSH